MSAELPISPTLSDAHVHAVDACNRWRGHCVEGYARLEEAATLTLASLPLPQGAKRPTVFGERMKALKAALAACTIKGAAKLLADLEKIDADLAWRNRIVHAAGTIYVDRRGEWLWCYRFQPSKAGAIHENGHLDQRTASEMEKRLSSNIRSICDRLRDLRTTA
jgi:hypothetical protein